MAKKAKGRATTVRRGGTSVPVEVQEDEDYWPQMVTVAGKSQEVVSVDGRWEDDAEWWEPVTVDKTHYPVMLAEHSLEVASIDNTWEDDGARGEPAASVRMHYQVTLEDSRSMVIFRNMKTGGWYQVRSGS